MRNRVAIFLFGMGIMLFFLKWSYAQWVQTSGPGGGRINTLAVSGENLFAGTYRGGVFLSSNKGANWSAVNSGLANIHVCCLAIKGENLFAGTAQNGVFLSQDNGNTWKAVNSGLTNKSIRSLVVNGENLFAGSEWGDIFLSTNNAKSWTVVNSGLPEKTEVFCFAVKGKNLFAGMSNGVWRLPLSDVSIKNR